MTYCSTNTTVEQIEVKSCVSLARWETHNQL